VKNLTVSLSATQLHDLKDLCSDADSTLAGLACDELAEKRGLLRQEEEALLLMLLPDEEDAERAAIIEVGLREEDWPLKRIE